MYWLAIIIVVIISIIYAGIKMLFKKMTERGMMQLSTKPILGICPSGWVKRKGLCVEPGVSLMVNKTAEVKGSMRGECVIGSVVSSMGTKGQPNYEEYYCEEPGIHSTPLQTSPLT